jgi:hypothetical protein
LSVSVRRQNMNCNKKLEIRFFHIFIHLFSTKAVSVFFMRWYRKVGS